MDELDDEHTKEVFMKLTAENKVICFLEMSITDKAHLFKELKGSGDQKDVTAEVLFKWPEEMFPWVSVLARMTPVDRKYAEEAKSRTIVGQPKASSSGPQRPGMITSSAGGICGFRFFNCFYE